MPSTSLPKIQAKADISTVDVFFSVSEYRIPTYQREFSWEESHIRILFKDLFQAYDDRAAITDSREPEYFLGAVVTQVGEEAESDWLIDGHQRITCLALILCSLAKKCSSLLQSKILKELLYRDNKFILQIDGYEDAFHKFLHEKVPARPGSQRRNEPLSVMRLKAAFDIIDNEVSTHLPNSEDYDDFAQWMLRRVFIAHIQDTDPTDTQRLFDRINTRGKRLSDGDRFRSKVLVELPTTSLFTIRRDTILNNWSRMRKEALAHLNSQDPMEAERVLLSDWLIARFAGSVPDESIQQAIRYIERDPYQWADEGLRVLKPGNGDIARLFQNDFFHFVKKSQRHLSARNFFSPHLTGLRSAELMKLPLAGALAAVSISRRRSGDLPIISRFLDVIASRRGWLPNGMPPEKLRQLITEAILEARSKQGRDLGIALQGLLAGIPSLEQNSIPVLRGGANRKWIAYMLGRFAWHLAELVGDQPLGKEYFGAADHPAPEIEHLMGNNFHEYNDLFANDHEKFVEQRNILGALIILPRSVNAALQSSSYHSKLPAYASQNPLAQSLCRELYDGQMRFRGLGKTAELGLRPMPEISLEGLQHREAAYTALANEIWDIRLIAPR